MSIVKVQGNASGTGIFTVASPNSNTDRTLTLPDNTGTLVSTGSTAGVTQAMLASGVAGNGPAFSAYMGSNQSVSNATQTKVAFDTEAFDTANCFDTTNRRFTPNVAGYYLCSFNVQLAGPGTYTGTLALVHNLYKNGGLVEQLGVVSTLSGYPGLNTSKLIYMNGTSDYLELYVYTNAGAVTVQGGSNFSHFEGYLARAA